jgi:hypothetical protein
MNQVLLAVGKALGPRAFSKIRFAISLSFILWLSPAVSASATSAPQVRAVVLNQQLRVEHEVLILYASETAPTRREASNYALILDWLDRSEDKRARTIAAQLRKDLVKFPGTVDSEIRDITEGWERAGSPLVDVAIFTNRLARARRFLVSDAVTGKLVERSFQAANSSDYILSSNVLAQEQNLKAALHAVAQVWSPATSKFVLVTNSHGNGQMAVTPRLIVHSEKTTKQELLTVISGRRTAPWSRPGITRNGYLKEIAYAGVREKMSFVVVLPHSCNEDPANTPTLNFPANVGTWLDVTGSAPYDMVNYAELFSAIRAGESLSSALLLQMRRYETASGSEMKRQPTRLKLLPFVPLFLTLSVGCFLIRKGDL